MLESALPRLSRMIGAGGHAWLVTPGVGRGRWSPGVLSHTTLAVCILSLMLQVCRSQRDVGHYHKEPSAPGHYYLNPSSDLPPHFLSTPVDVTVREGSMAVLPCAVQYLGPRQVAWRRVGAEDNHFLTVGTFTWARGNNVLVEYHQEPGYVSHWNLLIKNTGPQDAGVYECQITAKDKIVRFVTLSVTGPPVTQPGISVKGKQFVEKGEPIHLVCNATGGAHIPEDIDWFKDGSKIDTQGRNHVVLTKFRLIEQRALISELIIDHSRMKDSGQYICRSSDKEIASLKVTVLVADTNNVKRDKPEGTTSEDGEAVKSQASTHSVVTSLTVAVALCTFLCSALVT